MSNEVWLPIPGYEGLYEVSDQGRVASVPRMGTAGGLLRHVVRRDGYPTITLSRQGKMKTWMLHALVLMAHVGPRPDGLVACHNDGDPSNFLLTNLRWGTLSENNFDQVRHGTHPNASREFCIRGHPLAAPNLLTGAKARGRQCRACQAGRNAVRDGRATCIQEYADAFLARL